MALIAPRRAAELHAMPGVNLHIGDGEYPAIAKYAEMINDLDIKLYRTGLPPGTIRSIEYIYANTGALAIILTSPHEVGARPADIVATIKRIGKEKIAFIELYNEPDGFGKPSYNGVSYPGSVRVFAQDLYNRMKDDTYTADIKIIGTSPAYYNSNTTPSMNVADLVDYGNSHPYPADQLPDETTQFGCWFQAYHDGCKRLHGTKPVIITEDGYYKSVATTATDNGNKYPISERAFAKYINRRALYLFENSVADVYRWILYELRDGSTSRTNNKESQFGICNGDGARKPAFMALKSLLAACKDGATDQFTFTPTALDITFSGDISNLQTRLMQKANGNYILAIWRKLRSYQHGTLATRKDLDYSPTNLTITLPSVPSNIAVVDTLTTVKSAVNPAQTFNVAVADSVVLVELSLTATPVVTPPPTTTPIVTLYADPNYLGTKAEFTAVGFYNLSGNLAYMDNITSSIKVTTGYKVTSYHAFDSARIGKIFTASNPSLDGSSTNYISSIKIEKV